MVMIEFYTHWVELNRKKYHNLKPCGLSDLAAPSALSAFTIAYYGFMRFNAEGAATSKITQVRFFLS
jgi:ribosomal protein S6